MSPEAVSSPQGTQQYCPCAVLEVVADSAMANNNGPVASRGAGPMPSWFGDGAEATPGPDPASTPPWSMEPPLDSSSKVASHTHSSLLANRVKSFLPGGRYPRKL